MSFSSKKQYNTFIPIFIIVILITTAIIFILDNKNNNTHIIQTSVDISKYSDETKNNPQKLILASIDYPPYYGPNLDKYGFISEIIYESFQYHDIDIEIEFMKWDRALEATRKGLYDGVFTMWYSEERSQDFLFSDPLPANELVFFGRIDTPILFETMTDLQPYTIGTISGYAYPKPFLEANLTTEEVSSQTQNFVKLLSNRIDLMIIDKGVGKHIIEESFADEKDNLTIYGTSIKTIEQYLAVPKANNSSNDIIETFNSGLKTIQDSGQFNQILQKHRVLSDYAIIK